ncbi:hypothetical protein A3D77_05535 [Candidatus Gottesmanbacteria bacterium RIFCSPHIGHO2_02_FULL_39_11]|uniref:Uncharacterized protein n=1 Tax=Candidatus Gottesmanbacteria bacterium RIFCSPHIGHO2_02_FULL_39_11 TaxID=1798382 RepID=A0A1F5ZLH8_9BACT|nr:MAG: hypothetical protein A3D77_05535 [Candidatus Gottesmanbacteria bacterium RIFCSPHIGHO2_02_FULL_39_11]
MLKLILFGILIYFFSLPKHAHAYLDPGTGSYIFQIILAGLFGSIFFLKSGIKKIKGLFKDKSVEKETDEDR